MTIKIDEDNLRSGLLGLIVALVEVIDEVLEREAMKRMESGRLQEEEINRLGKGLMDLEYALKKIKTDNDIDDIVAQIRSDLDMVVNDSLHVIAGRNERTVSGDD